MRVLSRVLPLIIVASSVATPLSARAMSFPTPNGWFIAPGLELSYGHHAGQNSLDLGGQLAVFDSREHRRFLSLVGMVFDLTKPMASDQPFRFGVGPEGGWFINDSVILGLEAQVLFDTDRRVGGQGTFWAAVYYFPVFPYVRAGGLDGFVFEAGVMLKIAFCVTKGWALPFGRP